MGKPDDVVTASDRKTLIFYQDSSVRQKFHLLKDEFDFTFLSAYFLFQPDGILEKKFVSETGGTSTTQLGVRTIGKPISDEQLGKVIPKVTRYEEALTILGPPVLEMLTIDGKIVREWAFIREPMFSAPRGQVIHAIFDYDTDIVQDFVIRDDLPPGKKKKTGS